ncbi:MAG: hypothetical protein IKJ15_02425 [Lachnospiraceae bacterium]|nr:hypothetical protein [Lachnospiraceae bacterium]
MRNFEERKAEVFRRSENRIKERKRNWNRVLALCIPLCLVVTIGSIAALPSLYTEKSNDAECEDNGSIYGDTAPGSTGDFFLEESKTHKFVSVSVKGKGYDDKITDTASVGNVFDTIYNILEANGGYKDILGDSVENEDDVYKDLVTESTMESERYTIVMKSIDGTERIYILDGKILYDQAFDNEISLTKEQLKDLLVALELADY